MAGSVPAAPPKQFGAGNEAGGEDNSSDADGGQLYQFTFEQALGWPSVTGLQDPTIEPDPDPDDIDTQSLTSTVADFVHEFGRTYSSFRSDTYLYPNDEPERDRLDLQYFVMSETFGTLHFAPFDEERPPKLVLDVGTGTGVWCIQMGDRYPSADILGIDISPIQPCEVPLNVRFMIDDARETWTFPTPFDYIHTRCSLGSYSSYKTEIAQQAFRNLTPGTGWLEAQEITCDICCDDESLPRDGALVRWADEMRRASAALDRPLSGYHEGLRTWFEEVGFTDVRELVFKIPLGHWPKDRRLKELGARWRANFIEGLSAFSMAIFHRAFQRSAEETELDLVNVRREANDSTIHAYHQVTVVIGRKPFPHEGLAGSGVEAGDVAMAAVP